MKKIFISYSRHDQQFVKHLATNLEQEKVDTWVDWMDIPGGEDWQATIDQALRDCDLMLLIVTPDSMVSDHVQREVDHFVAANKTIIPVLLKQAVVRKEVRKHQYVDFETANYFLAFLQLCVALKKYGFETQAADSVSRDLSVPVRQTPLPLQLKDMLEEATKEVWLSGIALDYAVCRYLDQIEDALKRGVIFRIMAIHFDEHTITDAARWLGCPAISLAFRLLESMRKLKDLSKQAPSEKQLQLMTIPFRPGFGYVIIDPGTEDSSMSAAPYIYEIDIIKDRRPRLREQPPMFYLSRKSTRAADQQWFDMFQEEFVQLWNCAAQSWPLDWVNGQLVDKIQLPSPCSEAGPAQAESA